MVRDLVRDQWHGAAPRADVKRAVRVPRRYFDTSAASRTATPAWLRVRSPDASVLDAEGTTAGARRNLGRSPSHWSSKAILPQWHFTIDEHVGIGSR